MYSLSRRIWPSQADQRLYLDIDVISSMLRICSTIAHAYCQTCRPCTPVDALGLEENPAESLFVQSVGLARTL